MRIAILPYPILLAAVAIAGGVEAADATAAGIAGVTAPLDPGAGAGAASTSPIATHTAGQAARQAATQTATLAGVVLDAAGAPVAGANVFLFETLEGDLTDPDGRFAFETGATGAATLVVLADGFVGRRLALRLPVAEPVMVRLMPDRYELDPIIVEAGRLDAGDGPRVALNSLDVVTTPGAAADVYHALRTFPGLQPVDEGAGLFVRGGDVFETRIFLNDAVVLAPYRYESPTGGFFGAFDPFLLEGVQFSTGGFGARYGDALSGVAALETMGGPQIASAGATLSLASASATAALPLPRGLGARATATRSNTELLFRLNGTTAEFTAPPEGRDLSGSLTWSYDPDGELKVFALEQRSRLGVVVEEPSYRGAYEADERHDFIVASWRDRIGGLEAALTVASASGTSEQAYGAFRLRTGERLRQARGHVAWNALPWLELTAGGEIERRTTTFRGEVPAGHHDGAPDAPTLGIDASMSGTRDGASIEAGAYPTSRLRLTAGLRTDRSTLPERRTWDPRLAAAYRPLPGVTLLGAWGVYHQVPAPYMYERAGRAAQVGGSGSADGPCGGPAGEPCAGDPADAPGESVPPPMRATHAVVGLQLGGSGAASAGGGALLRVEAYEKRYRDLAQSDRDGGTVTGGVGRSRGVDLFLKLPAWRGLGARVTWSHVQATRTDPDTGTPARSPFDITHAWTVVVDYRLGAAWQLGVSYRRATGRPFTPVIAAEHDPSRDVWVPAYGEPFSERLPAFGRVDLAVSRLVPFGDGRRMLVLFAAVNNLFDRVNAYDVAYSVDYAERRFARSQFERSIYFGATFNF